ncbi:hypothetical protein D918_05404 [Trichuris suis]|nr:hypothetical protein D918_05404 [Trichuris suis]
MWCPRFCGSAKPGGDCPSPEGPLASVLRIGCERPKRNAMPKGYGRLQSLRYYAYGGQREAAIKLRNRLGNVRLNWNA